MESFVGDVIKFLCANVGGQTKYSVILTADGEKHRSKRALGASSRLSLLTPPLWGATSPSKCSN